jgi:hypothetical protein
VTATRTRFSARGPAAERGTVITFRLRKKGRVVLVVRNARCAVVGSRSYRGRRGINHVRFDGRVHGRPLKPGRYSIVLVVVRGSSRRQVGAIAVEVVPPGRRLTRAQRSAPVVSDCVAVLAAPPLPAPVVSTAGPPNGTAALATAPEAQKSTSEKPSRGAVLGVRLRPPPRVPLVIHGAPTWLGVLLVVIFGFSAAGLAVYVVRHVRDYRRA